MKPNELQHLLKNAKVVRVPISEEKTTIEMDENLVMVPRMEYANLVRKAAMLDALSDDLKARIAKGENYPIKDEIVMAVTGANKLREVLASESDKTQKKAEEDYKHIEALKEKLDEAVKERKAALAELEALKAAEKPKEEPHE